MRIDEIIDEAPHDAAEAAIDGEMIELPGLVAGRALYASTALLEDAGSGIAALANAAAARARDGRERSIVSIIGGVRRAGGGGHVQAVEIPVQISVGEQAIEMRLVGEG